MAALLEQKCPCCGGSVKFDSMSQKLKCPYCDTEFDVDALQKAEEENRETAEDNIDWSQNGRPWQEGETGGMLVYSCSSCGGEVVCDENTGATSCPYCGNPVVVKGQFSGDLRPDIIIPFKLDKKAAKQALENHISTKKLIPKIFKDKNHIDEIKGIYVPHWLFSCDASANARYRAETVRTWSDSNYDYTETSYYSIFRSGNLGFNDVPVDGSEKMDDALMESIEPFDLSEGVDFKTAYLAGYLADKYDVSADDSIARANERIKKSLTQELRETVQGYTHVESTGTQMNISNGCYKYALYPVWILNTSWEGKKFTFAMNGQTGKIVGDLPVDKKAFWTWTSLLGVGIGAVLYGLLWLF